MKVAVGGVVVVVDVVVEVVVGEMVVVVVVDKIKATTSTINTTTNTNTTNTTMHGKRKVVKIITATLPRAIHTKTIPRSPSIPYNHHNQHYNPSNILTTMTQHTLRYSTLNQ